MRHPHPTVSIVEMGVVDGVVQATGRTPMPYVRDSFWRGREFVSITEMQTAAVGWCREVAGMRRCRPLDGAAPAAVFATVEPHPGAVAASGVHPGGVVDAADRPGHSRQGRQDLYSVPWQHIGERLDRGRPPPWCSSSATELVVTHGRKPSGNRPICRTTRKRRSPSICGPRPGAAPRPTASAGLPGRHRRPVHDQRPVPAAVRPGHPALADKHGPARLEAACAKAITAEDPTYRTIRGILATGAETEPAPAGTGDGGARRTCTAPLLFSNVINMPVRGADVA